LRKTTGVSALQQQHRKIIDKIRNQDPKLAESLKSIQLDWFSIKNVAEKDETDVYIYDEIVPEWMVAWFGGVSAEGMIAQLNEISTGTINVRINSPGGAVFEAIAIYNALVAHSATINVYVDALAASAASVIAMAGDKVTMMVGSQMMIHDALGIEMGNAAELRAYAQFLDKQSDNIASIYAAKTGGDPKDIRSLMLAETWLFAQEAVDLGLADAVYSKPSEEEEPEEPGETESETPGEEEPETDTEGESEEESPENKMHRVHSLSNRGFNYAGRKKAPAPVDSWTETVNEILAGIGS